MNYIGKYRIKKVMMYTEEGLKPISREEIEQMDDSDESQEFKNMLKMIVEVGESELLVKIIATKEEAEAAIEDDPDLSLDENGLIILERHEIKQEDGEWLYECGEEDGEPNFLPFSLDEDGNLVYGGMMVLEKA